MFLQKYQSRPQTEQQNQEPDFENLNEPGTDIGFHLLKSKSSIDTEQMDFELNTQQTPPRQDLISQVKLLTEFTETHPSLHLCRKQTSDIQR